MAISSDTIDVQWLRSDQVKNPDYSQAERRLKLFNKRR